MIEVTLGDIASWVGGALADADPDALVTAAASADSRQVVPGGLFVAITGEHVDGHDFAAAAVEAGAVACLSARPVGVPAVVVSDPTVALGTLATAVLGRLDRCTVVGLTGSQGKTTTKDLLAQVLARHGPTVAPVGSYNTELGVPLTVLRADRETRNLVIEMGARGRGHIAYLCELTRPRVGLVLNVGVAHVSEFGSREGIAQAKGELVEALPEDGLAVLNADDPLVAAMARRTKARVLTFGKSAGAEVRIGNVRLEAGHPRFDLTYEAATATVELRLLGRHQASNAAAAAAVAVGMGIDLATVAAALSAAEPASRWRMEPRERPDGVLVLNDSYNANPDSMRAALDTLHSIAQARTPGRAIAVLGPMRELGSASDQAHYDVGEWAVRCGVDALVAVGADASGIRHGAQDAGVADSVLATDQAAALDWLERHLRPGDVVLVKASRVDGLERVAHALTAYGGDTATQTSRSEGEGSTDAL